jgi:hypothetical protein
MQTIRNFVAAALGAAAFLFIISLSTDRLESAESKKDERAFYLTTTTHNGSQTVTACAAEFHMASLWEIFDTSNLHYDTSLGYTQSDAGSGPPSGVNGWVRTGFVAPVAGGQPGSANCNAWSKDADSVFGTVIFLGPVWESPSIQINPWGTLAPSCDTQHRVWCVQN